MAATKKALNAIQLEFIFDNVGRMKQKDIAACLQVSPACVNKILKPKAKIVLMEHNFYIDKEWKQCYNY